MILSSVVLIYLNYLNYFLGIPDIFLNSKFEVINEKVLRAFWPFNCNPFVICKRITKK